MCVFSQITWDMGIVYICQKRCFSLQSDACVFKTEIEKTVPLGSLSLDPCDCVVRDKIYHGHH